MASTADAWHRAVKKPWTRVNVLRQKVPRTRKLLKLERQNFNDVRRGPRLVRTQVL